MDKMKTPRGRHALIALVAATGVMAAGCNGPAPVPSEAAPTAASSYLNGGDPLAGTWTTAKLTESDVVRAFVALGGSEKEGHEVFSAQQFLVVTLQFNYGVFEEYQSRDGGAPELGNRGTYQIGDDGTFSLVTGGTETYGYQLSGDILQLHFVKAVCPGDDCGPPIGPTLYTGFPFTRSS